MNNKELYTELCETERTICLYNQPWWLDATAGSDNWDVLLCIKDGKIIGSMPYYLKSKYGLKYITVPYRTQHNGVWIKYPEDISGERKISFETSVMVDLIGQLENVAKKQGVLHYQQTFSPLVTNWMPFYWHGYKQTTRYTYRLPDIHDVDQIFQNFKHNKRKNINKAKALGIEVKFDLPADVFYNFHKECLLKQGKIINYSYEEFERVYNVLYERNAGRTIYAQSADGKLLCALFNGWDSVWGYDWISAIDIETRNTGAPDLLVYSMICFLADKVEGYDFEGSMIMGVEESFRAFGTVQTPYFRIWKTYSRNPIIKWLIEKKLG